MRSELEEKIRIAELENQYNETLEESGISISIFSRDKEGRYLASFHKAGEGRFTKSLDEHDAQNALRLLPMTEDKRVHVGHNEYEMLPYEMETSRTPGHPTVLKIEWIHNDLELWFELPINERDIELMQYFTKATRELDETEIRLYIGQKTKYNKNTRENFQFWSFCCGRIVRFQGGYHKQISRGHLECIAESIINDDFAWERQ